MFHDISLILAGISLFFFGLNNLSDTLKQSANRKFRLKLAAWLRNRGRGISIGLTAGALTQSMSALAFTAGGMVAAEMITVAEALPMLTWANVGSSIIILVAFMDLNSATLFILGVMGILIYIYGSGDNRRFIHAVFFMALLLAGLNMIQEGTAPIASQPWFAAAMQKASANELSAILVGIVLTVLIQSSTAVTVWTIVIAGTGAVDMDKAILIIYGANFGSSALILMLSAKMKGRAKQIVMAQVLFNLAGLLIMVPLYFTEVYGGVPLVKHWITFYSEDLVSRMFLVYFLFNLGAAIVISLFSGKIPGLLDRYWPETKVEEWSKMLILKDTVPYDSTSVPDLFALELKRIVDRMPMYISCYRNAEVNSRKNDHRAVHEACRSVITELQHFQMEVYRRDISHETAEHMLTLSNRMRLVADLDEVLFTLIEDYRQVWENTEELSTAFSFLESLDLMIISLREVAEDADESELSIFLTMMDNRSDILRKVRGDIMAQGNDLPEETKQSLLQVSSLFERAVWISHQLGESYREAN